MKPSASSAIQIVKINARLPDNKLSGMTVLIQIRNALLQRVHNPLFLCDKAMPDKGDVRMAKGKAHIKDDL